MTARDAMKRRQSDSRARFAQLHAILADEELSSTAKCVATALLLKFRNTKTGRCNPSFAAIAKAIGRKRRAIVPAVAELKASGWLKIVGTKGGSSANTNSFVFDLTAKQRVQCTTPVTSAEDDTPTGVVDDTGVVECTRGVVDCPRTIENQPSPTEMVVCVSGANERAPDGALWQFERLCQIWCKPDGIDRKKAFAAFKAVRTEHDGEDVIASAGRWVAVTAPRYLPKLERWLENGAWLNQPQARKATSAGRGGKPNPVHAMLNAGGFEGYGND
jgi:hypothetical protein